MSQKTVTAATISVGFIIQEGKYMWWEVAWHKEQWQNKTYWYNVWLGCIITSSCTCSWERWVMKFSKPLPEISWDSEEYQEAACSPVTLLLPASLTSVFSWHSLGAASTDSLSTHTCLKIKRTSSEKRSHTFQILQDPSCFLSHGVRTRIKGSLTTSFKRLPLFLHPLLHQLH